MTNSPCSPCAIGYYSLDQLGEILDLTTNVYIAPYIESEQGPAIGQRIEIHTVLVTQPDTRNRVHYWRLPVFKAVYFNGAAFDLDHIVELERVKQVRQKVEIYLLGKGYKIREGVVAIPMGLRLVEGTFKEFI